MNNWYAVYTHLHKEHVALMNLENQGFETYLPRFAKIRKHARKIDTVEAPLFPRYMFVNFNSKTTQWYKINNTRGVVKILSDDHFNPLIVPTDIITSLKDNQKDDGLVTLDALALFQVGDKVRITDGAFKNLEGEFQSFSDNDRVKLLVHMLNKMQKVEVPTYAVEKA